MKHLSACLLAASVLLVTSCAPVDAVAPSSVQASQAIPESRPVEEDDTPDDGEAAAENESGETSLGLESSQGLTMLSNQNGIVYAENGIYELRQEYDPAVDGYSQRLVFTDFTTLAQTRVFTNEDADTHLSAVFAHPAGTGLLATYGNQLVAVGFDGAITSTLYSAQEGTYLGTTLAGDAEYLYLVQGFEGDSATQSQLVRVPLAGGEAVPMTEWGDSSIANTFGDWLVLGEWMWESAKVRYIAVHGLTGEQRVLAEYGIDTYRAMQGTTVYCIDTGSPAGVAALDLATGEAAVFGESLPWSSSHISMQPVSEEVLLLGIHDAANASYLLNTATGETTEFTLTYPDPRDGRIEVVCEAGEEDLLVRCRYRTIHWTDEYNYPGMYAYFYYALLSKEDFWAGKENYRFIDMEF